MVKNPSANAGDVGLIPGSGRSPGERPGFEPWVKKITWRRKRQPTPIFLLGKSHGQRSLADYSPWGHKRVRQDSATEQQPAGWCLTGFVVVFLSLSHVQLFCNPMDYSSLLSPWNFSGKNTGMGCHFLLQGIFLTQGSNPCLLNWQADSLSLSNQEAQLALC